jgi:hypothetical protein
MMDGGSSNDRKFRSIGMSKYSDKGIWCQILFLSTTAILTCEKYWLFPERLLPSALRSSPSLKMSERRIFMEITRNKENFQFVRKNTHVVAQFDIIIVLTHCGTVFLVIFHLECRIFFVINIFRVSFKNPKNVVARLSDLSCCFFSADTLNRRPSRPDWKLMLLSYS